MNYILFIAGAQGLQTLQEFLKYSHQILVVVPNGFSNEAIEKICYENHLELIVRHKGVPLDISAHNIDLLVSSEFPFKIDPYEYESVCHALNIHASILPTYKGRHSDVWSLINDEKTLGVTVHRLNERFDDGEVLYIAEFEINDSLTLREIYQLAVSKIPIIVSMINDRTIFSQDEAKPRPDIYWRVRTLNDSIINWHLGARKVFLFVRALSRPPIYAYSFYEGVKYEFRNVQFIDQVIEALPGSVIELDRHLHIVCGDGRLVKPIDVHSNDIPLAQGIVLH